DLQRRRARAAGPQRLARQRARAHRQTRHPDAAVAINRLCRRRRVQVGNRPAAGTLRAAARRADVRTRQESRQPRAAADGLRGAVLTRSVAVLLLALAAGHQAAAQDAQAIHVWNVSWRQVQSRSGETTRVPVYVWVNRPSDGVRYRAPQEIDIVVRLDEQVRA